MLSTEGAVPARIEIVIQAPSQAAVAGWVDALGEHRQLKDPWLTSAASRDEGDATFTVSATLSPISDETTP